MSPEVIEIVKYISSVAAGAGLTIIVIAKFGEKILFKHLDNKYAERLSRKNIELQSELEKTKNRLDRSLQQDVAAYKADLDVISGQRARFLEKKIDGILEINKFHVLAVKDFVTYINTFCNYVSEAADYFIYQAEEKEPQDYSSYDTYARLKRERWPQVVQPLKFSLDQYSEKMALTMPIFPKEFALKELALLSDLKDIKDRSEMVFYRTIGLTSEIIQSEEDMTPEECLMELKENMHESLRLKEKIENYNENLLAKAEESCKLIDGFLYT